MTATPPATPGAGAAVHRGGLARQRSGDASAGRWAPAQPTVELASYAALGEEPLVMVRPRPDGAVAMAWCNRAFTALTGYSCEEVVGRPLSLLEHRPGREEWSSLRESRDLAWMHSSAEVLRTIERKDGSRLRASVHAIPVGPVDRPSWVLGLRVSSDGLRADDRLRASEERFRALADQAPVGIFSSDVGLRLGYVNAQMAGMLGQPASECLGTDWLSRLHPEDAGPAIEALHQVLLGDSVELPLRLCPSPDVLRWVQVSVVPVTATDRGAGFVGTMLDVTEQRAFELRLRQQATHDPLTGLPNRLLLLERTDAALAECRPGDQVALFFLDLDDFKLVNDSLGHASGDALLEQVAVRLQAAVREGDLVACLGGDEFVVLCTQLCDEHHALALAARMRDTLLTAMDVDGHEVTLSASIGIALGGGPATSAEDLLRDADVAMYQAKSSGSDRVAVFDAAVRARLTDRLHLVNDLRRAVQQEQFDIVFQPVLRLDDDRVESVEALLRWDHPLRGPVSPAVFIPLAEQSSLIIRLGAFVLRRSCQELAALRRELGAAAPDTVSVNLSAAQLRSPQLAETVEQALVDAGLQGSDLCLELTESVLVHDPEAVTEQLEALRRLGLAVAMDDFGTGYSSLAYLQQLPVDRLKIDRGLLAGLGDPAGRCMAPAAAEIARTLGLGSVAEGVESPQQLAALRATSCTHVQGFHICPPLPVRELRPWLRAHAARSASADVTP